MTPCCMPVPAPGRVYHVHITLDTLAPPHPLPPHLQRQGVKEDKIGTMNMNNIKQENQMEQKVYISVGLSAAGILAISNQQIDMSKHNRSAGQAGTAKID